MLGPDRTARELISAEDLLPSDRTTVWYAILPLHPPIRRGTYHLVFANHQSYGCSHPARAPAAEPHWPGDLADPVQHAISFPCHSTWNSQSHGPARMPRWK